MGSGAGLTLSASGGLAFTQYGGGATAPFTAAGADALDLNGAPVTVTTTTPLGAGSYTLVGKSGAANVTGKRCRWLQFMRSCLARRPLPGVMLFTGRRHHEPV